MSGISDWLSSGYPECSGSQHPPNHLVESVRIDTELRTAVAGDRGEAPSGIQLRNTATFVDWVLQKIRLKTFEVDSVRPLAFSPSCVVICRALVSAAAPMAVCWCLNSAYNYTRGAFSHQSYWARLRHACWLLLSWEMGIRSYLQPGLNLLILKKNGL